MSEPVVRTFPAYAFGLLRLAAAERGEPAPRLLTGSEQDAVIRELLDAPDAADRWPAVAAPGGADPGLRGRAARPAAARGRARHRAAHAGRAGPRSTAGPTGSPRPASSRSTCGCSRCATRRTRGSVAYDQAELVRAAAALLVDDAGPARGRAGPLPARLRRRAGRHRPGPDRPARPGRRRRRARGRVRRPRLVDVRLPRRRPDRGARLHRAVPDRARRRRRPGSCWPPTTGRCRSWSTATRRVAARLRGPAGTHRSAQPAPVSRPARAGPPTLRGGARCARLTSESAYVAQRLREAHLHHGIPWSRMAVIVRSLQHHHAALRRALTQAGVPVTTGAEDTALATQPAVAPLLMLLRCALDESTLDEEAAVDLLHSPLGGADPFAERRLRQGLRAIAAAVGDAPALRRAAGRGADRAGRAGPGRTSAGPARPGPIADLLRDRAGGRPPGPARHRRGRALGRSGGPAAWPTGGPRASARGGRRGATADRDLDAVLVLFDAAARFTDRLPGARIEVFLDHLLDQQLPADTLAPSADRGEAVRMLTAHAAKGLEWDVVVVAGVQEGVWPDLRLRGSVLGSERLVDVAAGRDAAGAAGRRRGPGGRAARRGAAAVLRGGDPGPARAAGHRGRPERAPAAAARSSRAGSWPSWPRRTPRRPVEEPPTPRIDAAGAGRTPGVRAGSAAPAAHPAGARGRAAHRRRRPGPPASRCAGPRPAQLARLAAAGVPGRRPGRVVGPARPLRRAAAWSTTASRSGSLRPQWRVRCGAGCAGCWSDTAAATRPRPSRASATWCTRPRCWSTTRRAGRRRRGASGPTWPTGSTRSSCRPAGCGQRERDRAEKMVDKLLRWLAGNPREQVAIEQEFDARLRARRALGRPRGAAARPGRPARARRARAGSSWSTSRPARAPRARTTRLEHPQLAAYQVAVEAGAFARGRRVRRRRDRRGRHQPRQARRCGCSRRWPTATTRPGPTDLVRRAAARDGRVDLPGRRQRLLPVLPGAHARARCPAREGR